MGGGGSLGADVDGDLRCFKAEAGLSVEGVDSVDRDVEFVDSVLVVLGKGLVVFFSFEGSMSSM